MESLIEYLQKAGQRQCNRSGDSHKSAFYSEDGDSLVVFVRDTDYVGVRVDDFLTVYESCEDGGLVGVQVKGVQQALKVLGTFGVAISDGKLTLGLIFLGFMTQTTEEAKPIYRKTIETFKAEDRDLELPPIPEPVLSCD